MPGSSDKNSPTTARLVAAEDLFGVGEVVELGFEGLIVLALDLELGLEFFDQEFEARDFGAEF